MCIPGHWSLLLFFTILMFFPWQRWRFQSAIGICADTWPGIRLQALLVTVQCLALGPPFPLCCNINSLMICISYMCCVLGEATIKWWEASGDDWHGNHDAGDPEASSCGKVYGQNAVHEEESCHTTRATENSSWWVLICKELAVNRSGMFFSMCW